MSSSGRFRQALEPGSGGRGRALRQEAVSEDLDFRRRPDQQEIRQLGRQGFSREEEDQKSCQERSGTVDCFGQAAVVAVE